MSASVHTAACPFELVVVAASAGAVPLYREIFGQLDPGLAAPLLLVQHRPADHRATAELLARRAPVEVREPAPQEPLRDGTLYLAPSHAQVRLTARRRVALDPLAPNGQARADPVLVSAAAVYGPAVLAVVLSGRLTDGAAGALAVKGAGGRVIVQDPRTAAHPSMPGAALATGCVDACLRRGRSPMRSAPSSPSRGRRRCLRRGRRRGPPSTLGRHRRASAGRPRVTTPDGDQRSRSVDREHAAGGAGRR